MPVPIGESFRRHLLVILMLGPLVSACATLHVPSSAPTFKPEDLPRTGDNYMEIRAKVIDGINSYWDLFDEYLPEIGIAALWVLVRNPGPSEISLASAKWELRLGGEISTSIETDDVFKLYYKRRGIRMYSLVADQKARRQLQDLSLGRGQIRPGKEEAGFLFFRIPPSHNPNWARGAVLSLRDLREANGNKTTFALPLIYANP